GCACIAAKFTQAAPATGAALLTMRPGGFRVSDTVVLAHWRGCPERPLQRFLKHCRSQGRNGCQAGEHAPVAIAKVARDPEHHKKTRLPGPVGIPAFGIVAAACEHGVLAFGPGNRKLIDAREMRDSAEIEYEQRMQWILAMDIENDIIDQVNGRVADHDTRQI